MLIIAVIVIPALGGDDGDDPLQRRTGQTGGGFHDTVAKAMPSVVQIESGDSLGSGTVLDAEGQVGEWALAIGNPLWLRSSVTQGIVSSTSRTVGAGNGVALPSVIPTSAPIDPGNSGGALVDEAGAVIGIPTLSAGTEGAPAPGIGFAISSNNVKSIAGQLAEHGRVLDSGRAWLGVELRSLPQGAAIVAAVKRGGPAADAGIRPDDVILKIAGHRLQSVELVALAFAEEKPGDQVPVELVEPGGNDTVQVTTRRDPARVRMNVEAGAQCRARRRAARRRSCCPPRSPEDRARGGRCSHT
jgi:S1-C subfamily serine protease